MDKFDNKIDNKAKISLLLATTMFLSANALAEMQDATVQNVGLNKNYNEIKLSSVSRQILDNINELEKTNTEKPKREKPNNINNRKMDRTMMTKYGGPVRPKPPEKELKNEDDPIVDRYAGPADM